MPLPVIHHRRPSLARRPGLRDGMTAKQKKFADEYLANGCNGGAAIIAAGYDTANPAVRANALLKSPQVAHYINKRRYKLDKQSEFGVTKKLRKLEYVTDQGIPEDQELDKEKVELALKAMDMANKMQGHYAAEKSVNVQIDAEIEKVREITAQLLPAHEKEY